MRLRLLNTRPLLLALTACNVLALSAGLSGAQESDAPLIALPQGAAAVPLAQTPAAPAAGEGEGEAPLIRLAPAGEEASVPGAGGEGETTLPSEPDPASLLVERDRALAGGNGDADSWLLAPRPALPLPEGVKMGASLVAPGILRLSGETASTELLIDLPPGAPLPEALELTLHSSVNVLSEQASMQVTINGAEPLRLELNALGNFTGYSLPTRALQPGRNHILLDLVQPHRIFCGPEASFGVWTEINLAQSGLRLPGTALTADAAGFALAAQSQAARGQSIELLTGPGADPVMLRQLAENLVHALGPGSRVEQRSYYSLGLPRLASVALIASDQNQATIRRGAEGGIVLQVEHQNGSLPDLSAILGAFPESPDTRPPALRPGIATRLAMLGSADIIGNTHYFRRDIPFSLPADWLLMANQKARLDLEYGFARGLPQGAILLVKVNDQTVRLLPLDQEGGEIKPVLQVGFNANLLHPGRNYLSFEMMVPGNPPEAACQIRRADMLVVRSSSRLTVPPSPSMVLPGLAAVLMRLDPAAVSALPDSQDPAGAAEKAMTIALALDPTLEASELARLQVVSIADFASVPLEETGISLAQIQGVLFPAPAALADPAAMAKPVPAAGRAERARFILNEEEAQSDPSPGSDEGFITGIWNSLSPRAWILREARALRDSAFVGSQQSLTHWMEGRSGEALLLRPDYQQPGDLWLLLGPSASAAEVGKALNTLRADALAQGEAALLQADGSWQIWSPIRPPRLLEEPDFRGWRTALGNFASWSPLLFTLSLLGLALLSGLPALLYILLSRRRPEEK